MTGAVQLAGRACLIIALAQFKKYVQRSMLDSLFPELEASLADGWLSDISEEFHSDRSDKFLRIQQSCPEGSIFRITADGHLFDVRSMAALFANISSALSGYQDFERAQAGLAGGGGEQRGGGGTTGRGRQRDRSAKGDRGSVGAARMLLSNFKVSTICRQSF
jgi:hypothetical protein